MGRHRNFARFLLQGAILAAAFLTAAGSAQAQCVNRMNTRPAAETSYAIQAVDFASGGVGCGALVNVHPGLSDEVTWTLPSPASVAGQRLVVVNDGNGPVKMMIAGTLTGGCGGPGYTAPLIRRFCTFTLPPTGTGQILSDGTTFRAEMGVVGMNNSTGAGVWSLGYPGTGGQGVLMQATTCAITILVIVPGETYGCDYAYDFPYPGGPRQFFSFHHAVVASDTLETIGQDMTNQILADPTLWKAIGPDIITPYSGSAGYVRQGFAIMVGFNQSWPFVDRANPVMAPFKSEGAGGLVSATVGGAVTELGSGFVAGSSRLSSGYGPRAGDGLSAWSILGDTVNGPMRIPNNLPVYDTRGAAILDPNPATMRASVYPKPAPDCTVAYIQSGGAC